MKFVETKSPEVEVLREGRWIPWNFDALSRGDRFRKIVPSNDPNAQLTHFTSDLWCSDLLQPTCFLVTDIAVSPFQWQVHCAPCYD